jgi:hypothetical protein
MKDYSKLTPFIRHGGAYDRGAADAYYGRPYTPHYFTGDTYSSLKIEKADMNAQQLAAYKQGYADNADNRKEWN